MIQQILRFITANSNFSFYRIMDSNGNELFEYESQEIEEIKQEIEADYECLEAGKYKLLGKEKKASQDRAGKYLPFTIIGSTPTNTKTMNTFTALQVKEMVQEAEQRGFERAKYEAIAKDLSDLKKEFQVFKDKVSEKFDELDGNKDNDLLTKIAEIAPHATTINESLKSFSLK